MRHTMPRLGTMLLVFAMGAAALGAEGKPGDSAAPPRLPRKDCFLGLHFDLHPGKADKHLGEDLTEKDVAALLDRVRPDFVQYDCKGHAGYTGYPTRVGWASPGIVKDSLAIWRKATRERGVGLYIHYSGVFDMVAIEHHPDWARLRPDGSRDPDYTSTFGPYVDKLMIPQLREVFTAYDLDGAWVDGDCWGAQLDGSPAAVAAWKKETGFSDVPKSRNDPHWLEWKMFHRRQFEKYLRRWVDAVHATHPKAQLTSNWMYTTLAPLPVVAKLDYLSGDYSPTLSIERARVDARYLASTAMPWDLLAWGFNTPPNSAANLKPAVQLQQESAVVLMQGGAFSVYYQPTRSGYVVPQIRDTMGEVAEFCRARQKVSHKSVSVPQVALLLSSETQFDRSDAVFHWAGCMDELEGALHALLENRYSVDILAEHQLQPRLAEFPLVVVPDSYKLAPAFKSALVKYVEGGGNLLLLGEKSARLFEPQLGVRFEGPTPHVAAELATGAGVVSLHGAWQKVVPTTAEVVLRRHPTRDTRTGGQPAATVNTLGKGRMAAVYGPVALGCFRSHHPALRRLVGDLCAKLFPDPAVRVDGPPVLDMALRRTADGRLSVHLLNTAGMQLADRYTTPDFVPPVGPIRVQLRVAKRPSRVALVPGSQPVSWSWRDGVLEATVPQLAIHGVLVVD
jgi:hypothetical protein